MRLISLFILGMILQGCTSIQSPSVDLISVEKPYPASLVLPCDSYEKFLTSDIQSVIVTHTENMEKAINCKNKHNELIEIIKERKL